MRYRRNHHRTPLVLGFNATPLVDVIFLLTVFFMLVSRFSSAEQVPMELPQPEDSRARVTRMPERVVINCRSSNPADPTAGVVLYSIGPNRPELLVTVADRLAAMKRQSPNLKVVVRADRRLPYADVRMVMQVIAGCDVEMLNIVAHVGEDE